MAVEPGKSSSEYFHAKWAELHNMQSPTAEKLAEFAASLPSFGCSCKEHFGDLIKRIPPPFERGAISDIAWFAWTFRIHNEVRAILPTPLEAWEYQLALQQWRPHRAWRKQAPIKDFVAVTSLSPNRFDRQSICLNSWRKMGLEIVSVNSQAEIDSMRDHYPVAKWIPAEFDSTPKINSLLDVSASEDLPILLINADIEIYGDQSRLLDLVECRNNAIGIRHNYETHPGAATREAWGLDAFLVYPEQVPNLSRTGFTIGKPMWDYWLPWELEQLRECEWITEPYFFHASHPIAWTQQESTAAHEAFAKQFGPMDWSEWRYARPAPPFRKSF